MNRNYSTGHVELIGQRQIKGLAPKYAENACWYASAKMVLNEPAGPPFPEELLRDSAINGLIVERVWTRMGLQAVGGVVNLSPEDLGETIETRGPLLAYGRFAMDDNRSSDFAGGRADHCVVVIAVNRPGIVVYHDPWEPRIGYLPVTSFNDKLHIGNSIWGSWKNNKQLHTVSASSSTDTAQPSAAAPAAHSVKSEFSGRWQVTIGSWTGVFNFDTRGIAYWADQNGGHHHNGSWWQTASLVQWRFHDSGDFRTFSIQLPVNKVLTKGSILPAGQGYFEMKKLA